MLDPIYIDLETRSACDLKEAGSFQYAHHETTRLLTVAWKDGSTYHVWLPGLREQPPESYRSLHLAGITVHVGELIPAALCRVARRPWVGHNCWTFDRLVWNECAEGFEHVNWVDTYPLALACGMPGGLNAIGKMLWGEGKYEDGKKALKKVMRCEGLHDCEPENVPLGLLMLVAKYNVEDVKLTADLHARVTREALLPPFEHRVKAAHDVINNRGVRLDIPFTRALVKLADQSKSRAVSEIARLSEGKLPDVAAIQSRAQVIKWLGDNGVRLLRNGKDCLAKDLVARYIDANKSRDAEDFPDEATAGNDGETDSGAEAHANLARIVKVLELRMSALRVTGGKLDAALHAVDGDGRIRHWAAYWGSHTGRWAGRRLQPHNFPRPKEGVDCWGLIDLFNRTGGLDYDAVLASLPLDARGFDGKLLYPYLSVDDAASALLRSVLVGDPILAAADLANIEARVLAWCAGETWLMRAFWNGTDPYMAMAERMVGPKETWPVYPDPITGKPLPHKKHPYRQILGKVPYLAAGYQGGADAIARYAANMGHDLADYGTTGMFMMRSYRDAHPHIAGVYVKDNDETGYPIYEGGVWRDVDAAVLYTVETGQRTYGARCQFVMASGNLVCILPSGRRLVYRNAQAFDDVGERWTKRAVRYQSPRFGWITTYGGKLVENIVQAISRDILAHAMVLLEDAGMPVVLHVHDEAVSSTDNLPAFMRCMTTQPEWLTDFPLAAEGSLTPRYAKSPPPTWAKDATWQNGVSL